MSEQPQSIQPPDEPLDPYTLELAIDKLSDRIIDATDERDAEAVRAARSDLIALLAFVNPRARVVVLPEPDGVDEDDEPYWPGDEFESVTVELSVENKHYIYFPSSCQTVDQARIIAGSILAAAEFAGGAK